MRFYLLYISLGNYSFLKVIYLSGFEQRKRNVILYQNYVSSLVRQMGLEPIRHRHTPLKRACLPIPALPQNC